MRVSLPASLLKRPHAAAAALWLALVASLAGCASQNPLIDETAAAPSAAPAASQETAETGVSATGPTGIRRLLGSLSPYRIDIQQGNFVSREMVDQLREGMTREQVRFVLGTPLLNDIFHDNRWDYVFRLQKGSGAVISSRVAVHFEGDRLVRIEGGELPTEAEYLAFITDAKGQ